MTNPVVIVLTESIELTTAGLAQASLLKVVTDTATTSLVTLPVYASSKAARLGGLKKGNFYFDLNGRLQIVKSISSSFLFDLSQRFTFIGKF